MFSPYQLMEEFVHQYWETFPEEDTMIYVWKYIENTNASLSVSLLVEATRIQTHTQKPLTPWTPQRAHMGPRQRDPLTDCCSTNRSDRIKVVHVSVLHRWMPLPQLIKNLVCKHCIAPSGKDNTTPVVPSGAFRKCRCHVICRGSISYHLSSIRHYHLDMKVAAATT